MNNFFNYAVEVAVVSAILYLGFLAIGRYTSVRFRRIYLLTSLMASLVIPLASVSLEEQVVVYRSSAPVVVGHIKEPQQFSGQPMERSEAETTIAPREKTIGAMSSINIESLLTYTYFAVVGLLLFKVLAGFISIYRLVRAGEKVTQLPHPYYLINRKNFTGASFFHLIFIGSSLAGTPDERVVYDHELIHAKRGHSFDVLLAELYCCLFWVNPVAWFFRHQIRINTEYEADEAMTQHLDKKMYAHLLIDFSGKQGIRGLVNSFSARSLRKRIASLYTVKKENLKRGLLAGVLFYAMALLAVACVEPWEVLQAPDQARAMEGVKTVTTTFTSHQRDTKEKDNRTIAIAYYHPDGTIDRVDQHMTYPYTNKNPFRREFWSDPDPVNVPLIMDGLELGEAESNILYGNDWPVKYAEYVKKGHPNFRTFSEIFRYNTTVEVGPSNLPTKILTEQTGIKNHSNSFYYLNGEKRRMNVFAGYEEAFTYDANRVTSYSGEYIMHSDSLEAELVHMITAGSSSDKEWSGVKYGYDGDLLTSVDYRGKTFRFFYDESRLVKRAEYYIKDTMYNLREHFYNDEGLRLRTEIYNVDKELEFTIDYKYEFYGE